MHEDGKISISINTPEFEPEQVPELKYKAPSHLVSKTGPEPTEISRSPTIDF